MKQFSLQAIRARRLAIFCLFASSILLFAGYTGLLMAGKAAPQAGWRFEIEEGQRRPSNVAITNICKEPHLFSIDSKVKYLIFAQPTDAILAAPGATELVNFVFDATKLKSGVYRDTVFVKCVNCKKEQGCQQDRQELPIEMTVIEPTLQDNRTSVTLLGDSDKTCSEQCAPLGVFRNRPCECVDRDGDS